MLQRYRCGGKMTQSLDREDVEALFALIYWLKDWPVQTREAAAVLRAQEARRGETSVRDAREFTLRPGGRKQLTAVGPRVRGAASAFNDLGAQIATVAQALDDWFALGEPPPALPLVGILFHLIAAEAESLEMAFLAVFCRHFGAEFGERYGVLLERATACGVYPLAGEIAGLEDVEPRARSAGPFDDFSLDDNNHADDVAASRSVSVPEAVSAQRAPVLRPANRLQPTPAPDTPRANHARKAREALFETRVLPDRKGLKGVLGNLLR